MSEKLPDPDIITPGEERRIDELIAVGEGRQLVAKQNQVDAVNRVIDVSLKGDPAAALGGTGGVTPGLADQRSEAQDIELRQEALDLMVKSLPSEAIVDRAYFDGAGVGDAGEFLPGKTMKDYVPQSVENTHLGKMMPKDWKPPPIPKPDQADIEFLKFWPLYFKETGEVPMWEDLEEYDRIRKRAYGSLKRGEKAKRRGFQVTGRHCRKPGCDGEIRHDPDRQVEQCFECLEFTVVQTRDHLRRV